METSAESKIENVESKRETITYEMLMPEHYNEVYDLWLRTEGVGIGAGDSLDEITYFLEINEGYCFVAKSDNTIVGTILCGNDGRRGYLYHAAVDKNFRYLGIAKTLTEMALNGLKNDGISKCHLFVFKTNTEAQNFWSHAGWKERTDLIIMSKDLK